MKALFVPLKQRYFDAFSKGEKRVEWRRYGPQWNERTLVPGRDVVLSAGYSGARRRARLVTFWRVSADEAPEDVRAFYPDHAGEFVAVMIDAFPDPPDQASLF